MQRPRGRDVFMESLAMHGVEFIFGNPGTTESPIMDSLSQYPNLRYIMALHEAVALGAAHYYAQASGKTAVVNLHVAPGLGNALGMLYNAWEANTPLLVTAGQQDTRSRLREPLLGHDLVGMAAPLVKWSVQAERADELGPLLHRAFKISQDPPAGPVFVALPIDVLEQETNVAARGPSSLFTAPAPQPEAIAEIAQRLRSAKRPAIVVGDAIARSGAQADLVELAEALGAPVFFEGLVHRLNFPLSHQSYRPRMPLNHAGIQRVLGEADTVLLIGGSFFEEVWHDPDPPFPKGAKVMQIEDSPSKLAHNFALETGAVACPRLAIQALLGQLDGSGDATFTAAATERNQKLAEVQASEKKAREQRLEKRRDKMPISTARLMAEVATALPDDAVLVNESITAGGDLFGLVQLDDPQRYYGTRGGGIGQGLPGGIGASLAHPGKPVVVLSGDGSAMYSIQALWTAAHDQLPITFVILHNREYKILKINMDLYRERFGVAGDRPYPHMNLTEPELGFVEMAQGMGIKAVRVKDPSELGAVLQEALSSGEPRLVDVLIEGRIED